MKYVWKNSILKISLCALGFSVLFFLMFEMQEGDFLMIFRMLWAGEPLTSVVQRGGFLLACLLSQYVTYDSTAFFLKNDGMLLARYGSKHKLFFTMERVLWFEQFLFLLLMGGCCFFMYMIGMDGTGGMVGHEVMEVFGKQYLFCVLLSQVQIILSLLFRADQVFLAVLAIVYLLSVVSMYDPVRRLLFPTVSFSVVDIPFLLVWFLLFSVLTLIAGKIIQRKENL